MLVTLSKSTTDCDIDVQSYAYVSSLVMVTTYFIVSIYCGDCPMSQGKQSGQFLSLSLSQQPFADVNIAAMTILRYSEIFFGL